MSTSLSSVGQRNVVVDTRNVGDGSAQNRWENVSARCQKLSGLLDKVGNDQLRTDEAISAEIAKLKTEYKDTPAVGGQSKGR